MIRRVDMQTYLFALLHSLKFLLKPHRLQSYLINNINRSPISILGPPIAYAATTTDHSDEECAGKITEPAALSTLRLYPVRNCKALAARTAMTMR